MIRKSEAEIAHQRKFSYHVKAFGDSQMGGSIRATTYCFVSLPSL